MNKKPLEFIIIDDDPHNNLACTITIKAATGINDIRCFTAPEEALDYISNTYSTAGQTIPTILFLDINMPGMNGWEVLERFKEFDVPIKQHITIYILSSSVSQIDQEMAYSNPLVADYIIKPLSKDKIQQIVARSQAHKNA